MHECTPGDSHVWRNSWCLCQKDRSRQDPMFAESLGATVYPPDSQIGAAPFLFSSPSVSRWPSIAAAFVPHWFPFTKGTTDWGWKTRNNGLSGDAGAKASWIHPARRNMQHKATHANRNNLFRSAEGEYMHMIWLWCDLFGWKTRERRHIGAKSPKTSGSISRHHVVGGNIIMNISYGLLLWMLV